MHTHRKACVLVRQEQIYFLSDLITANCSAGTVKAGLVTLKTCYSPPPGQYENKSYSVYIFFQKQSCYQMLRSNWHHILLFSLNALICFFNTHLCTQLKLFKAASHIFSFPTSIYSLSLSYNPIILLIPGPFIQSKTFTCALHFLLHLICFSNRSINSLPCWSLRSSLPVGGCCRPDGCKGCSPQTLGWKAFADGRQMRQNTNEKWLTHKRRKRDKHK